MKEVMKYDNLTIISKMTHIREQIEKVNIFFLNHQAVKKLIDSNQTFDVVIYAWMMNEAFLGLSHHFKASSIAFSTVGSNGIVDMLMRNPSQYSYIPNMMLQFSDNMNMFERTANIVVSNFIELMYYFWAYPSMDQLLHEHFPSSPPIKELTDNISLVLLNSHISIESPRPLVPTMIQIGGFHVEEPKQLPSDLKSFLDDAVEGAIFFSLGSNVRIADLPEEKQNAIIRTFANLPVQVLWKTDVTNFTKLPSNVKIGKWLPQRDILGKYNFQKMISFQNLT